MKRCEHNCHLCKKEWLGRCYGGQHYGKDVSLSGKTDVPICDEYEYGGSPERLKEINRAIEMGVTFLMDNNPLKHEYCQLCVFQEDCTDEQKDEVLNETEQVPNNNPLSIYYNPSSCFQSTLEVYLEGR